MKRLLLSIFFLLLPFTSLADTVHFTNGKSLEVDSAWIEGNSVMTSQFGGVVSYPKKRVASIETEIAATVKQQEPTSAQSSSKTYPARQRAEATYRYLSEHPYSPAARKKGLEDLEQARMIDPNEPEIFLSEAIIILQDGFKKGKWYKKTSFRPGTVDKAMEKVNLALKSDPLYSKSHSVLAWFHIIKQDFSRAEQLLDKAYQLDSSCFYYWLYRGTLSLEKNELTKAGEYFDRGREKARTEGQRNLIFYRKKAIARLNNNLAEEENLYIAEIDRDPNNARKYGKYGYFLLCHGRFDEAIEFFTKALEIEPYPDALLGLSVAEMRNSDKANCKKRRVQI